MVKDLSLVVMCGKGDAFSRVVNSGFFVYPNDQNTMYADRKKIAWQPETHATIFRSHPSARGSPFSNPVVDP